MEIANIVLEYLKVLVLPIVVITGLLIFRQTIAEFFTGARDAELSIAGFNIKLARKLSKAESTEKNRHPPSEIKPKNLAPFPVTVRADQFKLVPAPSEDSLPPAVDGMFEIDILLIDIAKSFGLRMSNNPEGGQVKCAMRFFKDLGIWDDEMSEIYALVNQTYLSILHTWTRDKRVSKAQALNKEALKNASLAAELFVSKAKKYWENHPELPVIVQGG